MSMTGSSAAAAPQPGLVLAGFRLVEQLGSDGLGELFRAQNVHAPRLLRSIRVIRPELAAQPDFRAQLLRVAELLDVLEHPNLLRLHHLGEEGDFLFTVHDLLLGRSLRALTSEQRAPRPVGVVTDWLYQALCGLGHAHQQGIIHQGLFLPSLEPIQVSRLGGASL
jgi:serine/threonine-protein kinase